MNTTELISHYTFTGLSDGPVLIVLGAIHGDETCGPVAIKKIMHKIDDGSIVLKSGTLRCVPVCNPRAYEGGVRYAEDNLNRIFRKSEDPQTYEARLANELCELVDKADVLLDIHSSHAPAPVNLFVDYPTPENEAQQGVHITERTSDSAFEFAAEDDESAQAKQLATTVQVPA